MLKTAKMTIGAIAVATTGLLAATGASHAAIINAPVPNNALITQGGLDWAWANPLPGPGNGFDLSFQGGLGWRIPTAADLASAPLATAFMFPGANVPLGGSDAVSGATFQATNANLTGAAACAAPYFSTQFLHCDWQDGLGQPFGPWAGMSGAPSFADQLAVRNSIQRIPVPGTLAILGVGLAGLGLLSRRR